MTTTTSCHLWPHYRTRNGFGQCRYRGKIEYVHRVAYQRFHGRPPQRAVLQSCRNRLCCNPHHLVDGDRHSVIKYARGTDLPQHKLTEEQVRTIRRSDQPRWRLAKRFGVSVSCVSNVVLRKSWKHL